MYHVFVVNENTFKYHLEYKFAGTGAQDRKSPFLADANTGSIHSTTERNLVGMIADVSRIRVGDKIIFYLQASGERQGTFYGVFKANSKAFFNENNEKNYLIDKLGKGLSYRIAIEPDMVFPLGITEHEYLDSLEGKDHPYQICWSLIYRKLKGNRGCTMITDYEFEDLINKLNNKNNGKTIDSKNFTFDINSNKIVAHNVLHEYDGKKDSLDITKRMLFKANRNNAFEVHLQAYLLQNFERENLRKLLLPKPEIGCWIGNEVSCGVGMQRIDILVKQETKDKVFIKVIELKCTEAYYSILSLQIPWYLEWVIDYVAPNYAEKTIYLIPCIVAKTTKDDEFLKAARNFNYKIRHANILLKPLEYISFEISRDSINFSKII